LFEKYPINKGLVGPVLRDVLLSKRTVDRIINDRDYHKILIASNRVGVNLNQIAKKLYGSNTLEISNLEKEIIELSIIKTKIFKQVISVLKRVLASNYSWNSVILKPNLDIFRFWNIRIWYS